MAHYTRPILGCSLLALLLSGCPVTDEYFVLPASSGLPKGGEPAVGSTGGAATSGAANSNGGGMGLRGGAEVGGSSPTLGGAAGEPPLGGGGAGVGGDSSEGGVGGEGGAGGGETCVPLTEACNGRDDDCDLLVDETACETGCTAFVLDEHGYMFCGGSSRRATWLDARTACVAEGMLLVSIETAGENTAVTAKINALASSSSDKTVHIGAHDYPNDGTWMWDGGFTFWQGDEDGSPVGGAYSNWGSGYPNGGTSETCAALYSTGTWNDRSCEDVYAYVCEEAAAP